MIPLLNSRQLDEGCEEDNGESKCSDNENDDNLESSSQIVILAKSYTISHCKNKSVFWYNSIAFCDRR